MIETNNISFYFITKNERKRERIDGFKFTIAVQPDAFHSGTNQVHHFPPCYVNNKIGGDCKCLKRGGLLINVCRYKSTIL